MEGELAQSWEEDEGLTDPCSWGAGVLCPWTGRALFGGAIQLEAILILPPPLASEGPGPAFHAVGFTVS